MNRMILAMPRIGEFETTEFPVRPMDSFGLEYEEITYLDGGASIVTGKAATTETREETVVYFDADGIEEGREPVDRDLVTEFIADLDAGFVAVDSSDGEFLWKRVSLESEARLARVELDLQKLRHEIGTDATYWHVAADDGDGAQMLYHDHVEGDEDGRIAQLGFEYLWNDQRYYGVAAESGYVAVYSDPPIEHLGRWVREVILPTAYIPQED